MNTHVRVKGGLRKRRSRRTMEERGRIEGADTAPDTYCGVRKRGSSQRELKRKATEREPPRGSQHEGGVGAAT